MDRNQTIGIVLISLLFIVYITFFSPEGPPPKPENKGDKKEAKAKNAAQTQAENPKAVVIDSASLSKEKSSLGIFSTAFQGTDSIFSLENEDVKITFSSKGGSIQTAELKKYKTWDKKPLLLSEARNRQFSIKMQTANGPIAFDKLFFNGKQNGNALSFKMVTENGKTLEQNYVLSEKGYTLDYSIKLNGIEQDLSSQTLLLNWKERISQNEKDINQMRTTSNVNFYQEDGTFDNLTETKLELETEQVAAPLKWISFKQKFFNSGFIAKQTTLNQVTVSQVTNESDSLDIKTLEAQATLPIKDLASGKAGFTFYFGPNKFNILNEVTEGYEKNVYLGWPIVSWVNKLFTVKVFAFLEGFISNYGLIIILLVLLVKIVLFPLSYKSYISMAKMKVLKPELDEIKARVGEENMQAIQQEQMKLYNQMGINPLSGCIPLLLQMPILLSMFNFFPNSIELRQQAFLWAPDLSTYDSIFTLPFFIPSYGNHVSLFTILMTASTLVWTWYNNQTSTVTGPMQSVSYIMPVVFMFILNSLPAGLSFYYFVSNVVSILQQQIIKRFVNEDELHRKLQENKVKNANKKKTGFAARIEEAMRLAEEAKRTNKDTKPGKKK